jgi:D-3-phosphoglycerate dehydrogenase
MDSRRVIICPDAQRFPMSEADRILAASAGAQLVEIPGRQLADLEKHGAEAVGCLAWGGRYGAELLDVLPRLRVLARCGAGIDNIDLDAARARGVIVTYVPGASDEEVSDHTIALMLACLRDLVSSDAAIRRGEWPSAVELSSIRRVRGTRLGLIGLGRIASAVAAKAACLGAEVAAFDPFVSAESFLDRGVRQVLTLEELLTTSDVISLHMPPLLDGRPMLGPDQIALMRSGAVIINTGRGSLIDEPALCDALRSGHLGAAGLDVFRSEPLDGDSPLLGLRNVVLTPHSAAFSEEALANIRQTALSDALAVLDGRTPSHPIEAWKELLP